MFPVYRITALSPLSSDDYDDVEPLPEDFPPPPPEVRYLFTSQLLENRK